MEIIDKKCCGLDVHKKVLVADLRSKDGKGKTDTRSFGTSTEDIVKMIQWLLSEGCEMIAVESMTSYWKPVFNLCEQMGLPAMVVNAQHINKKKAIVAVAHSMAIAVYHILKNKTFRDLGVEYYESLLNRKNLDPDN